MSFSVKNLRNISSKLGLTDPVTKEPIVNPETNLAVELELVNADSKVFDDAQLTMQLKTIELMKLNKKLETSEHRTLSFELFASLVIGWSDTATEYFREELGDNSSYSQENVVKLLSNPEYWWIVRQIEVAIKDKERFFTRQ